MVIYPEQLTGQEFNYQLTVATRGGDNTQLLPGGDDDM